MATSCSLETILEQQCEKLKVLEIATIFISSKKEIKEELFKMYKQVDDMHGDIEVMRNRLKKIKEQNNRCVVSSNSFFFTYNNFHLMSLFNNKNVIFNFV